MKVSGDWLTAAPTQAVCAMLETHGHQALLVGGCVRNALLHVPVNDIDISTDARPERVMELAKAAGLNAIPTGIEHGTVTVVAKDIPHEITTFRRDVETDGRRAVVAFSDHVEDDAHRRDFTMNALYARSDGTVVDPLGGLSDLKARRLRFIDNAEDRIREDYLRILRYFRFHAYYGDPAEGMDPEALAAIAANTDGLASLSKERVGSEMMKLLGAPDPAPAVAAMRSTGVLGNLLPGAHDRALAPLVHLESSIGLLPDPIRRLTALGGADLSEALRLSKKAARQRDLLHAGVESTDTPGVLGYRHGHDTAVSILLLRAAMLELPLMPDALIAAQQGSAASFPIRPADLMDRFQGAALGKALKALEAQWIASEFTLSKAELLAASDHL
ncbi:CCA tRNA nucleotidyltransferase [Shimia sp. R11_0]|uniref:CCA tRNA nucleotidyltransferase n=1 Tax=Shimia sp. R11_0 TaxID=2821096 RepID=UPI001ADA8D56|nr:CCA tRNA nucleotidyltransferase [Shimia sp. R11_0]MBO9476123.1 CCA tRNA nucleotidyltransferase [Shimia sp. R11_0]